MKIAFTTKGEGWGAQIDPRFGRTEYIFIFDDETNKTQTINNSGVSEHAHGAGPMTAQIITDKKVDIVITGNGPGGNALRVINAAGIKIYAGAGGMTAKQAYDAFKEGNLN
ncbi:MAG: NifB/NifX family molybdenum-iron cluster-binding protein [Candidatus Delongbacteria bacterium]